MSKTTSPSAGKPYGPQRVCRVLELPRATIYAQEQRQAANVVPLQRARRGPKPKVSDADPLAAIRADLAASFFTGEGHRKVWARHPRWTQPRVAPDARERPTLAAWPTPGRTGSARWKHHH
ncbi:MAG: hypothetical protein K6T56_11375 [Burkholderiales bacterium]|nr:hypothetical protein [Burkholderiales bacterium]